MSKVKLTDIISPNFKELTRDALDHKFTDYTVYGGRGSTKSSWASIIVPLLIIQHPSTHALVLRKVANTIGDSVFNQYLWGIDQLGLTDYFIAKRSPFELIYKPTKQRIMFRGTDDPMKIKSIKLPFGYIAITHFEELDQFAGRQEIRNVLQSTRRGGDTFWNIETFNPPISRENWANIYVTEEHEGRVLHQSTYLEVPEEWLGRQFILDAEHLKAVDENAYKHEYLGIPVGTGGNVFKKLELRDITDEEIKHFDRIFMGADWGWFPDPFAFVRVHYDRQRETIYFIDEHFANETSNEQNANWIKEHGYNDTWITCDGAEPKSVADFRHCGLNAQGAIKGAGSVEYGMKWLQSRKIVIDKRRTPNVFREFVHYEYERNKDGEIMTGYPDRNNHSIDATRYALERMYKRYGSNA